MPLGFLVPAFLAGFAALLVPLVLHLRRKDRRRPTPFPSLMFLARMPVQTDSKRRVTDIPLLLLRLFLLILLVTAFARPFLRGGTLATNGSVALTVLLVDRSASMSAVGVEGAWADSARAVLSELPDGRRVAVVAFDADATILAAPTTDHAAARAAIGAAPDAAGTTRFGAGLRAAAQLLAHEPVPGEIVMVTDMQRTGLAATTAPALPAGTALRVVTVAAESLDNSAVVAVDIEPVSSNAGRRAIVAARIDRRGGELPRETKATLSVDGRDVATLPVSLPANGPTRVTFDTVDLARSEARVSVTIEPDGLPIDDSRFLIVPSDASTRITLVVPRDVRDDEARFLERALEIGRDPNFTVNRVTRLDRTAIEQSAAVILLDVAPPDDAMAGVLSNWITAGGGLVVVAGERLAASKPESTLLAAQLKGSLDRERGAVLGNAQTSHPALSGFRDADANSFSSIRIRRHAIAEADEGSTVLLSYDDGTPAVVAGEVGSGRIILIAIPVDARRGDFPLQPSFLPFVRGVASWASSQGTFASSQESGQPWLVPASIRAPLVKAPSGDLERPAAGGRSVVLREPGIHQAYEGRAEGLPQALVAVNSAVAESDLTPAQPTDLMLGVAEAPPEAAMSEPQAASAREAGQRGWRWLLLAMLVILGVEIVVASRGWRGVAAQSPVVSDTKGSTP